MKYLKSNEGMNHLHVHVDDNFYAILFRRKGRKFVEPVKFE